jgi:chromosome segregation ATPase
MPIPSVPRPMRWIARIVLVGLAVIGGQKLWERQMAAERAVTALASDRRGIGESEAQLDELDRAIDESETRLRELDGKITSVEAEHPGGIPASIHPEYARLVAAHNQAVAEHNALVARHTALRSEYTARVDRHNAHVEDANESQNAIFCSLLPDWLRARGCGG